MRVRLDYPRASVELSLRDRQFAAIVKDAAERDRLTDWAAARFGSFSEVPYTESEWYKAQLAASSQEGE